ncbi:hypothetical protein FACS189483_03460 [Spirochaetia bacterium]|nr:hypothetical protein FACS189483_03460 [Spirochaetia bacterium]
MEALTESQKLDAADRLLGYKDHADYLRANSPQTIAEAERKFKTRKSISCRTSGLTEPESFVNIYQWNRHEFI